MVYTICIVYIYGHRYNNSNTKAEKESPCCQEQFTFKKNQMLQMSSKVLLLRAQCI